MANRIIKIGAFFQLVGVLLGAGGGKTVRLHIKPISYPLENHLVGYQSFKVKLLKSFVDQIYDHL